MRKSVQDITVGDVYTLVVGRPATVRKGSSLKNAIDAIVNNPYSQKVYVVDGHGKLLGTVTMAALLRQVGYRLGARKPGIISFFKFLSEMLKDNIEEFMEHSVSVTKDMLMKDALQLMVEYRLNNLPVVDEKGKLIGELNGIEILTEAKNYIDR